MLAGLGPLLLPHKPLPLQNRLSDTMLLLLLLLYIIIMHPSAVRQDAALSVNVDNNSQC